MLAVWRFDRVGEAVYAVAARGKPDQLDLLRDVFLHAYFDGLSLPKGHAYGYSA